MATPRIFISMGTPYTDTYRQFRDALEGFLRDQCGADPRIIGKNDYPDANPLAKIKEVMQSCHGVVVVAYERKFVSQGEEKRTSPSPLALTDRRYTTPWNHVESAMAFSLGLPLYIICQNGLAEEGLIETKMDWYVQYADIDASALNRPEVTQSIQGWVRARVAPNAAKSRIFRTIEGDLKLSEMTPKEIWAAVGLLTATFSLGAAAAHFVPKLFG
jgi:hypothetical protein